MISTEKLLIAIRAHCLDCCGGRRGEVERCSLKDCTLHPYRTTGSAAEIEKTPSVPEQLEGQLSMFGGINA